MNSQYHQKKVFVGLSGGVDSAVSAALLKKTGYIVTGVFIKVWQPDWIECNWKDERRDAMRVAAHLGIPFLTLDLEKKYKEGVIDYMIAEYGAGRTPNPDVMCNREIKFGAFWAWAKAQGANYIATGHYARVTKDSSTSTFELLTGKDSNKDQSYFLWTLNQNDLDHILFPVGHLEKPEVRRLAKKFKLPNSAKKDSQGLCFIGKLDIKDFLAHYLKSEPGNVLSEDGEVIGNHSGSLFFTIGERHGFTVTTKASDDDKYYVIEKDTEQNTITVSNRSTTVDKLPFGDKKVIIQRVNWVEGSTPPIGQSDDNTIFPLQARTRYRQALQNIRIVTLNIAETTVEFEKPQNAITPGQSLVIYDNEKCLGGGIIE